MTQILTKILLLGVLGVGANLLGAAALAAPRPESTIVAEARELIDAYYGNRNNLQRAAELLESAYQADPGDANVFVQSARITAKGGHLAFDNYATGTFERYGALLDKAISLDNSNPKAHILKAQVFEHQRRYDEQLSELNKAKALGTSDPWLSIGFGKYYTNVRLKTAAYEMYSDVERRGPGSTASERNAYIAALGALARIMRGNEKPEEKLRKNAALALKARYPTDAWTPYGYAEGFLDVQLFDEAIFYAREALKTMDFGAGRLTLSASLYAKAAQLLMAGHQMKDAKSFVDEAEKFGFSKSAIIEYLVERRGFGDSLSILTPTLNKIIR